MTTNRSALPIGKCVLVMCLLAANVGWPREKGEPLTEQTMLHPLDAFTAQTLRKNEWIFHLPIPPTPGWVSWGVTDRLTVELDAEAWLGGVPSIGGRFKIMNAKGLLPAMAVETMYQYLPRDIDLLEDYDYLDVTREGNSWSNRINFSWELPHRVAFHVSPGVTYSEFLQIDNGGRPEARSVVYEDLLRPDISVGLEWRAKEWVSLHATYSQGATFVYLDNVPRKTQYTFGTRLAPFPAHSRAILRNLRLELAIVSFSFSDVDEAVTGPLGYIYWQW